MTPFWAYCFNTGNVGVPWLAMAFLQSLSLFSCGLLPSVSLWVVSLSITTLIILNLRSFLVLVN